MVTDCEGRAMHGDCMTVKGEQCMVTDCEGRAMHGD